jgi:hypothetical protein
MLGCLPEFCFASCEYNAAANICLNINIFQFYCVYLRFGRLVVDFGVWMVLAFYRGADKSLARPGRE